jgi:hypothetical protein
MITLEYNEEADDSKYPDIKFKCKNMFVYDLEHNDFRVEVSGERIDIEFTGAEIRKEYGNVITKIKINRDYDGITIEHLDAKGIVYCKTVVRDYAFDYFEIRSLKKVFKDEN